MVLGGGRVGGGGSSPGSSGLDGRERNGRGFCGGMGCPLGLGSHMGCGDDMVCSEGAGEREKGVEPVRGWRLRTMILPVSCAPHLIWR